jgi:hypothetical protein
MSRTASANRPVRPSQSARHPAVAARAPRSAQASAEPTSSVPTASGLIAVMSELQSLVTAENDALRRGLPAAAVETTDRKERLHQQFRSMYRYLLRRGAPPLAAQDAAQMQELGESLRSLATENAARLDAALKASQQRVEQVMEALRRRVSEDHAAYGRDYTNVHTLRAHFSDYGRSLEV